MSDDLVDDPPMSEDMLERIADIIGWHSAAGRALTELRRRLAAGEDVACYNRRGVAFVVGPRLKDRPA